MTANGQPVNSAPVPVDDKKTRYAFLFPLRPGTTQFQVAYQLPYTGSANIDPHSVYPLQHFVAILPKGMQFSGAPGANYQSMNDPQQPDANVQVASSPAPGQSLAFKISGEGTLQASVEGGGAPSEGGAAQSDNRPGGGLGPPIDAPNPLQKYQLYILGGLALALVGSGVFIASRQLAATRAGRPIGKGAAVGEQDEDYEAAEAVAVETRSNQAAANQAVANQAGSGQAGSGQARASQPRSVEAQSQPPALRPSSMLLEGLKEEIFQLEVEHKQGTISQQEYEKTKAALDQTLQRALKREAAKQT